MNHPVTGLQGYRILILDGNDHEDDHGKDHGDDLTE